MTICDNGLTSSFRMHGPGRYNSLASDSRAPRDLQRSRENNVAREPQTRGKSQLKVRIVCFLVCASAEHPCLATLFSLETL